MQFNIFSLILGIGLLFTACSNDKVEQAATLICECNSELVAYNKKMQELKANNDAVAIVAMQDEGSKITDKAAKCLKKLERKIGEKRMKDKNFEVKLIPIIEKKCPEVYEAYKKANGIKK